MKPTKPDVLYFPLQSVLQTDSFQEVLWEKHCHEQAGVRKDIQGAGLITQCFTTKHWTQSAEVLVKLYFQKDRKSVV